MHGKARSEYETRSHHRMELGTKVGVWWTKTFSIILCTFCSYNGFFLNSKNYGN